MKHRNRFAKQAKKKGEFGWEGRELKFVSTIDFMDEYGLDFSEMKLILTECDVRTRDFESLSYILSTDVPELIKKLIQTALVELRISSSLTKFVEDNHG